MYPLISKNSTEHELILLRQPHPEEDRSGNISKVKM